MRPRIGSCVIIVLLALAWYGPAWSWGDEGHEVVALIARSYLEPGTKRRVEALLAADPDTLTAPTIQDAATWADKYRNSDRDGARRATRLWHFVDLELNAPDLDKACYGHPRIPAATPASAGPADDCIVDKIEQFAAELNNPATTTAERIVALKFLLHLVGDLHQPLHASDDHDRGGNDKRASMPGVPAGTLHHYWDIEFVEQLGSNPTRIAAALRERISVTDSRDWCHGTPSDWAFESFRTAKDDAYGRLPPTNARGLYRLTDAYVAMANRDVTVQLSKAGVRLACLLNETLGR
jgi:S1/P1 Nuclease